MDVALILGCKGCYQSGMDARLTVALLEDRLTLQVACQDHGIIGSFVPAEPVLDGCNVCGDGDECRH